MNKRLQVPLHQQDMPWELSYRTDPLVRPLADRHYNRQSIGHPHFTPPGRCLVLRSICGRAFWVTSFPFEQYTKHAWAGALVCSAFRNEGSHLMLSSNFIRYAVACTAWKWNLPDLGMVTFVNTEKVKRKKDPGYCFNMAGFSTIGRTKGGLLTLRLRKEDFPDPLSPIGVLF